MLLIEPATGARLGRASPRPLVLGSVFFLHYPRVTTQCSESRPLRSHALWSLERQLTKTVPRQRVRLAEVALKFERWPPRDRRKPSCIALAAAHAIEKHLLLHRSG